jgi:hypothetical protein
MERTPIHIPIRLAISLSGVISSGFKPAPVLPICSFMARYCFLSLMKVVRYKMPGALVWYLRVGDIVVDGFCILVQVGCEVSSDCRIVIDRENTICNL